MAKSRAWFFPTSPRSPEVVLDDLKLMARLDGRPWGLQIQQDFAALWAEARGIDPAAFHDPGFTARDRMTRAPRLLGLTHKPDRGQKGPFVLTEAGHALLEAVDPTLVFQRQIAKVQFSSPLHNNRGFEDMRIRPLTAIVYLMNHLGQLTLDEIAMFVLTTIHYKLLNSTITAIQNYRGALTGYQPGRPRAEFREEYIIREVDKVYDSDILAGELAIREGNRSNNLNVREFLKTKRRNLRDYADATMRYLVATGIFVRDIRAQALTFSVEGSADGQFLLDTFGLEPIDTDSETYDSYVVDYLGSIAIPSIRRDNPEEQASDLDSIANRLETLEPDMAIEVRERFSQAKGSERLQLLRMAENTLSERMEVEEADTLLNNRAASAEDILQQYEIISDWKSEQVARPLAYEWNTWRAFVIINDALSVRGNFTRDIDGRPRTTAPAGTADILVEFESFILLVEVTLSKGARQYETEGEPIMRHLGRIQLQLKEAGDTRPVFALFIAESLNQAVIPFMRTQALMNVEMYGGFIRIVPIRRSDFVNLMNRIIADNSFNSGKLLNFLQEVTDREFILNSTDETWMQRIAAGIS